MPCGDEWANFLICTRERTSHSSRASHLSSVAAPVPALNLEQLVPPRVRTAFKVSEQMARIARCFAFVSGRCLPCLSFCTGMESRTPSSRRLSPATAAPAPPAAAIVPVHLELRPVDGRHATSAPRAPGSQLRARETECLRLRQNSAAVRAPRRCRVRTPLRCAPLFVVDQASVVTETTETNVCHFPWAHAGHLLNVFGGVSNTVHRSIPTPKSRSGH